MEAENQSAPLAAIAKHCDSLLKVSAFTDWEGAYNGLQVENQGRVTRIAAAVDASLTTVRMATETGADLLLVHHGLFWNKTMPWTAHRYQVIRTLIEKNLAVYSAHLPLDAHPTWGNNVLLAKALGLKNGTPFFQTKGQTIGYCYKTQLTRSRLTQKLAQILGHSPTLLPGGSEKCRIIGIVTGGAGSELHQAAAEGVDTFITGEGPHWTFATAEDLGINVLYGGHYATETFGVKALAEHLSRKFRIPWEFLDHPTGL